VYLECAKRGVPWGSGAGKSPSEVQRQSPGMGSGGRSPQKLTLFVNECLNFDVLEEQINKTAEMPS